MAARIPVDKVVKAYYSLKPSERTMLNTAKALYKQHHIATGKKTVWNILQRQNIDTSIKRREISDEEIVHRYIDLGEKVKQIARGLHTDAKRVSRILKRNSVEFKPKKYLPVDEIVELYEYNSIRTIAKKYHTEYPQIKNVLISAGIEVKPHQIPLTPFEKIMYNHEWRQMPESEYKSALHDLGVVMVCFKDFDNYFKRGPYRPRARLGKV
jgi:hypothetical protein